MSMKRILHIAFCMMLASLAWAQQDPMYSQFMFNKLAFNPAYAGSREQLSVVMLGRRQWMGFDGAPKTENIGIHMPSGDERHGFGLNFVHDVLGYTASTGATANYAFRIPVGDEGYLSLGLNMGMRNYVARFSQVPLQHAGDAAFNNSTDFNKLLLVAGTGVYFQNQKFYFGAAVPDFVPHKLEAQQQPQLAAKSVQHLFVMGGAAIPLGESLELRPSALLRAAQGAPLGMDIGMALRVADILQVGGMWRPSNGLSMMMQVNAGRQVFIGYAYDMNFNAARSFAGGSHEICIGLDLNFSGGETDSKLF
jgi:type IX secretion system PorP/SprF family membrane protein